MHFCDLFSGFLICFRVYIIIHEQNLKLVLLRSNSPKTVLDAICSWRLSGFRCLISLSKVNLPLIGTFTWPTPPGPYRATTCRGRELNYGSHTYFLTTQGHGGPSRMSDQLNAGVTSETAQTWKTIHTKHTLSHPYKAKMEWWWRRPNDIRGPCGPKVSWHLSFRWGKKPEKPHPGNLSRPGIEPGPAAWQARMLPLAPQRWTIP